MNPNIPVVNVSTRERPTYLPPEVCMVLPGQIARTKLSPEQTQSMIRFAVRKPCDNAESILRDGLSTVGLSAATNPRLVSNVLIISAATACTERTKRCLPLTPRPGPLQRIRVVNLDQSPRPRPRRAKDPL